MTILKYGRNIEDGAENGMADIKAAWSGSRYSEFEAGCWQRLGNTSEFVVEAVTWYTTAATSITPSSTSSKTRGSENIYTSTKEVISYIGFSTVWKQVNSIIYGLMLVAGMQGETNSIKNTTMCVFSRLGPTTPLKISDGVQTDFFWSFRQKLSNLCQTIQRFTWITRAFNVVHSIIRKTRTCARIKWDFSGRWKQFGSRRPFQCHQWLTRVTVAAEPRFTTSKCCVLTTEPRLLLNSHQ